MAVPVDRVVEVRARRAAGDDAVGSGFRVGDRLVLTAQHVVSERDGRARTEVVARRGSVDEPWMSAEVLWKGDRTVDVALLRVPPGAWAEGAGPVRWGRPTGTQARVRCEAVGFPSAMADRAAGARLAEHLDGHLNPGTASGDRYDISLDSTVPQQGQWNGMSGAALFAGDILLGVVVLETPHFDGRRLTAVPIRRAAEDVEFVKVLREEGIEFELESVELSPLFAAPTKPLDQVSVATILRADIEAVTFAGRTEILRDLAQWCEIGGRFSARLVVGPGGQGKTRLARELARRMRATGWVGGFVTEHAPEEAVDRLAATAAPVLLVVDYAETRASQLQRIATVVATRMTTSSIRLLLLARAAGDWWSTLQAESAELTAALREPAVTSLEPLHASVAQRAAGYRGARQGLARALGEVAPEIDWVGIERTAPVRDSRLPDSSTALEVQMAALVDLLQVGPDPVARQASDEFEAILLRHEQKYWRRTAMAHNLDLRSSTLRGAVAAATIVGAATEREALQTISSLPGWRDQTEDRRLGGVRWLREIYPAIAGMFWGPLQPDRLAEHLAAEVTRDDPSILQAGLGHASETQRHGALTVLARAAARDAHVVGFLEALVAADLAAWSGIALRVALETADPEPLLRALRGVVGRHDDVETLARLHDALPPLSTVLLDLTATIGQRTVALLRDESPTPQVALGIVLGNLAGTLGELGRTEEAIAAGEEAVELLRPLQHLEKARHYLATALNNLANRLVQAGRAREALTPSAEAVAVYRELAADGDTAALDRLASALMNRSGIQTALGLDEAALATNMEAIPIRRQLYESDSRYAPGLADSLVSLAVDLSTAGRFDEAIECDEQAIALFRSLVEENPDAYRLRLARAVKNQAAHLNGARRLDDALVAADEAVQLYRTLARGYPQLFKPELADALHSKALILLRLERHEDVVATESEHRKLGRPTVAFGLYHDAAQTYAKSHLLTAVSLIELGRFEEAAEFAAEAVAQLRRLHGEGQATEADIRHALSVHAFALSSDGREEEARAAAAQAAVVAASESDRE